MLKTDEEMELIQSDVEQGTHHNPTRGKPARVVLMAIAFVGIVGFLGGTHMSKVDVEAMVGLGGLFNNYIDTILSDSEGNCDQVAIVRLEDGELMTSDDHQNHLLMTMGQRQKILSFLKGEQDPTIHGIHVGEIKYTYLKQLKDELNHKMILAKTKGVGAITLAATDKVFVIAHTAEGSQQGKTNVAVRKTIETLIGHDSRRLQDDELPVVIELGSNKYRAGFADDDEPQVVEATEGDDKSRLEEAYAKLGAEASQRSVLITETPMNPLQKRKALVATMFDDVKVPSMYLANQAAMAPLVFNKATAMVLSIGTDAAYAVPVYETSALDYATLRLDLDEAPDASRLAHLIQDSMLKVDPELREDLYASVIIAGTDAFHPDKGGVKTELSSLAPPSMKVRVMSAGEEDTGGFVGGSIYTTTGDFSLKAITSDEYQEIGPSVVELKCF